MSKKNPPQQSTIQSFFGGGTTAKTTTTTKTTAQQSTIQSFFGGGTTTKTTTKKTTAQGNTRKRTSPSPGLESAKTEEEETAPESLVAVPGTVSTTSLETTKSDNHHRHHNGSSSAPSRRRVASSSPEEEEENRDRSRHPPASDHPKEEKATHPENNNNNGKPPHQRKNKENEENSSSRLRKNTPNNDDNDKPQSSLKSKNHKKPRQTTKLPSSVMDEAPSPVRKNAGRGRNNNSKTRNKRAILDDDDNDDDDKVLVPNVQRPSRPKQRRRIIEEDEDDDDSNDEGKDNGHARGGKEGMEDSNDHNKAHNDSPPPSDEQAPSANTSSNDDATNHQTLSRGGEEEDGTNNTNDKNDNSRPASPPPPVEKSKDDEKSLSPRPSSSKEPLTKKPTTKARGSSSAGTSFFQPQTSARQTKANGTTTKTTASLSKKAKRTIEEPSTSLDSRIESTDKVADKTQSTASSLKLSSPKSSHQHQQGNPTKLCLPPPTALYQVAPKDQIRSDQELWDDIDTTQWPHGSPVPYAILCQVFNKIEEITGRLQIQEILTTLLRQILLRRRQAAAESPPNDSAATITTSNNVVKSQHKTTNNYINDDLYTTLYLASNEVAPAYKCVELGIGDAILIKAIGEATGTAPNMVKAKYEAIGDLGTVAMTFKSKQRTLGGFFGVSSKSSSKDSGGSTATTGLTAHTVLKVFREIAETKGNQAQKWKVDKIKKLLVGAATAMETKYIIRGLQGKLRIGLAESTVLIALAHALALTQASITTNTTPSTKAVVVAAVAAATVSPSPPNAKSKDGDDDDDNPESDVEEKGKVQDAAEEIPEAVQQFMDSSLSFEKRLEGAVFIIKRAYSEVPSYDTLLDAALSVPLEVLHKHCTLQPGIPVAPMLAKPTKSIQEVLKRLNGQWFTCEYKYDGERAQIHLLPDGTTKVFSRNLLDTSEKYPEVPRFVREAIRCDTDCNGAGTKSSVRSFIIDAEVVAFNSKTGQLVPFQVLSTRKKTLETNETAKVQVIVQAFDLMYLNGESLLRQSLYQRRQLLHQHFVPVSGKFQFATAVDHEENGDTAIIEELLDQAVKGQCEGLMIKTLNDVNARYEPSRRSLNWLKLKKDYLDGLGDSVDLVPLGAYHGKGKRTGVYGAYLLACYDADNEEFQSVCKIGTGFSDDDLKTLADSLNQHVIPTKSSQYNVSDALSCDVWFDAVQVWEVKAADLSQSNVHRGAAGKLGGDHRGIGLRFPRFERLRNDKKPDDATTSDQILELYYNQDSIVAGGGGDDDDDMDGI